MSKSRGNVVNPDEMVDEYGADAFRLYEMFMGAFDQPIPWSTQGLNGMNRFLYRVWEQQAKVADGVAEDPHTSRMVHQTIRKVGDDIEAMKYNTAIAQLMTLSNRFAELEKIRREDFERFMLLLSPFAPHIAEELWERLGHKGTLAREQWPSWDQAKLVTATVTIALQVNGKLRGQMEMPADCGQDEMQKAALAHAKVQAHVQGKTVRKVIVVPGRLVNVVVG